MRGLADVRGRLYFDFLTLRLLQSLREFFCLNSSYHFELSGYDGSMAIDRNLIQSSLTAGLGIRRKQISSFEKRVAHRRGGRLAEREIFSNTKQL